MVGYEAHSHLAVGKREAGRHLRLWESERRVEAERRSQKGYPAPQVLDEELCSTAAESPGSSWSPWHGEVERRLMLWLGYSWIEAN